jgi:hypothetical protein
MFDPAALLAAHASCFYDLSFPWLKAAPPADLAAADALLARPLSDDLVAFWPADIALLAQAAQTSGQRAYLDRAAEMIESILRRENWKLPHHQQMRQVELGMSMTASRLSEAYLFLGEALPELRERISQAIIEGALEPFYLQATDLARPGWARTVMNWRGVVGSEMGRAALHLAAVYPRWRAVVAEAIKCCLAMADAGDPDGGWEEGVGYWNYGFGQTTLFAEELFQASRGMVNLFAHPYLQAAGDFGLYAWMPGGKSVYGFSDWRVEQPRSDLMQLLAAHTVNGRYQWAAERSTYSPLPPGWRAPIPAQPPDDLPPAKHFRGLGVAILRGGWRDSDIAIGFKCGPRRVTMHQHLDANSFVLFAGADALIDELEEGAEGKCTAEDVAALYRLLGVSGEAADRDAALGEAATAAHNTLLIGGAGQLIGRNLWHQPVPTWRGQQGDPSGPVPADSGARISGFGHTPALSWVIGEVAPAYPPPLDSFCRTITLAPPDRVTVSDQLRAPAAVAPALLEICTLFHVPGETELVSEGSVRITQGSHRALMQISAGPNPTGFRVQLIAWPLASGARRRVIVTRAVMSPGRLSLVHKIRIEH